MRERTDWPKSVHTVDRGFRALGRELLPVRSYTSFDCFRCGGCLQGYPTNGGKSTMSAYIHPAWRRGQLDLRPNSAVTRILFAQRDGKLRPTGVEYTDAEGRPCTLEAKAVVVAAGALNTPQLLLRSDFVEYAESSPSAELVGKHLGTHTARMVHGLFAEPQDCHMVYPITSRCNAFQRDEDGGFASSKRPRSWIRSVLPRTSSTSA